MLSVNKKTMVGRPKITNITKIDCIAYLIIDVEWILALHNTNHTVFYMVEIKMSCKHSYKSYILLYKVTTIGDFWKMF